MTLIKLLPILLPTAIYLLYVYALRRRAQAGGGTMPSWIDRGAVYWSVIGGLTLAIALFVGFAFIGGASPDAVYVPERYEDGETVPGHFIEPGQSAPAPEGGQLPAE